MTFKELAKLQEEELKKQPLITYEMALKQVAELKKASKSKNKKKRI